MRRSIAVTALALAACARPDAERVTLYESCRNAAESYLLAPADARWPAMHPDSVVFSPPEGSGQRYLVGTTVDTPNAAGVRIRFLVTCAFTPEGAGWGEPDVQLTPNA